MAQHPNSTNNRQPRLDPSQLAQEETQEPVAREHTSHAHAYAGLQRPAGPAAGAEPTVNSIPPASVLAAATVQPGGVISIRNGVPPA